MASPLNVFKTVTAEVTSSDTSIYTAPTGFTAIILMAQVSNVTASDAVVTFSHVDASDITQTELVKGFTIPGNDASGMITGKLVLEDGASVKVEGTPSTSLKITLSILESLNA